MAGTGLSLNARPLCTTRVVVFRAFFYICSLISAIFDPLFAQHCSMAIARACSASACNCSVSITRSRCRFTSHGAVMWI